MFNEVSNIMNYKDKNFFTLVLEISGVNFSNSMSYSYNGATFYLYPGSYFKNIKYIKKELAYINSDEFTGKSLTMKAPLQFETGAKTFSYIITEMELDLTQPRIEIYNEVYAYFEILLKIFGLIFEQFINIARIFILERIPYKYKLRRVICRKISSAYRETKPFNYTIQDFETQIPNLLARFYNNAENYQIKEILNEFIHAKKTTLIELKAIYLWNFLEHLTSVYSKIKNRNLLVEPEKYKILTEKIKDSIENIIETNTSIPLLINSQILLDEIGRVINSLDFTSKINQPFFKAQLQVFKKTIRQKVESELKESDILVEGYNKQKISDIYINLVNNFPGIIQLIKLMCLDLHYELSPSEENLIFYMNRVRNFYFHETLDNSELFGLLKKEIEKKENRQINRFAHQEFYNLIQNFDSFIEKLLFHMLSFPLNLKERRYSQSVRYLAYNRQAHPDEDNVSYFRNLFEQMYDDYTKEKKYHFLLRFIRRTIEDYEESLKSTQFSGIHFSESDEEDIQSNSIRFKNFYSGVLDNIKGINVNQIIYDSIVYIKCKVNLKNKVKKLDCLLSFQASTDIDFRLLRLTFETDLLDFQIDAEYNAKKNSDKYQHIKNAISPLPIDFLEDQYYQEYFKWPQEYKIKIDEKPEDMEVLIPIIVITIENLKEFKRYTEVLNIKNIQHKIRDKIFYLSYSKYQGTGNLQSERVTAWRDETIQKDLNQEFLLHFPFMHQKGFLFITNSPRLCAIFSLLFSKLSTMEWPFIRSFLLIHYYFILLYEIEKDIPVSQEYITKINEQRQDLSKAELNINNPDYIQLVFLFRERFLDLLLKILVYPKLKNKYNMDIISEEIKRNSIMPHLNNDYKGTAWLSFGLSLALYIFISGDRSMIQIINNEWTKSLVSILEEISGKEVNEVFFEKLFDFFDEYIRNH